MSSLHRYASHEILMNFLRWKKWRQSQELHFQFSSLSEKFPLRYSLTKRCLGCFQNVKMSSPCPKINRKCLGWNAIYGNEFSDFSSVFGSIWHVDYVCSYEKGWKKNVRESYINPRSTQFMPIVPRYNIKTNAYFVACRILMILYFHFAAQEVWRHPLKNLK